MTLVDEIGLGHRECVSIVGAGGKSTILLRLSHELEGSDLRVVVTTTTKMAPHQIGEPVVWSPDPKLVDRALEPGIPLYAATRVDDGKALGITPDDADRIYAAGGVDVLLIEADGARHRLLKAPASHEPAIPSRSTIVIVVVGADAVGQPASDVAHRPELVAALGGVGVDEPLTIDAVSRVILHDGGGRKGIPDVARVVVAVTTPGREAGTAAKELVDTLAAHPQVDRVIMVDRSVTS